MDCALKSAGDASWFILQLGRVRLKQEKEIIEFGQTLFDTLISGDVRTCYDVSWDRVRREGKGLRIKLRFNTPALAALPWEFLHDDRRGEYLVLSTHTPLVRYFELPQPLPALPVQPPLRILGMVANPIDLPGLEVKVEKQRVEQATADLRAAGLVELVWLPGQSWRQLQRTMRRGPWHIFHFIGHGTFDAQADEGFIIFANRSGRADLNATLPNCHLHVENLKLHSIPVFLFWHHSLCRKRCVRNQRTLKHLFVATHFAPKLKREHIQLTFLHHNVKKTKDASSNLPLISIPRFLTIG